MKRRGRLSRYKREFCTETIFCKISIYKKKVTEVISPMPQEVNEEEKTSVNGLIGNQLGNLNGSLTKENKRKTKLKNAD